MYFLSFLLSFYQYTALSRRAEDSHQMFSGGSVVGKDSLIRPPDIVCQRPKVLPMNSLSFFFYQYTELSNRAMVIKYTVCLKKTSPTF